MELDENISLANEGMLTLDKTKKIFKETNEKIRNILPENSIPYLKYDSLMSKRTAWWTEDERTGKYISKGGSNYQNLVYLQEAIGEALKKIKIANNITNNNQESNEIEENIKEPKIFLSYCHKDKEIADRLDKFFITKNILLTRDVRDALPYSNLIKYMKTIRDHDYVISLISDAYLKSTNCMFEVIQFIQEKKYIEKIFPIIIDKKDDIFNKEKHINYISFWQNKYKRFRIKINKLENTGTAPSHVELGKIDKIQSNIGEFLDKIAELKCFPIDELESTNYKAISDKIGKPFGVFQKEEIEVESEKLKLRMIGCLYKWYVEVLEQGITPTFNIEKKINEWKISSKLMHKVIDEMIDDGYIKRSSFGQIKLTKQGRLLARKEKLENKYDYKQCGKGD